MNISGIILIVYFLIGLIIRRLSYARYGIFAETRQKVLPNDMDPNLNMFFIVFWPIAIYVYLFNRFLDMHPSTYKRTTKRIKSK